jgi:cytosine deaminase
MLITNARLPRREGLWQLQLSNERIERIAPAGENLPTNGQSNSLDAQEGLIIAPFVEPHIHLDTTQTAGQPNWNQSGTLFEGIERWAERKSMLNDLPIDGHCDDKLFR